MTMHEQELTLFGGWARAQIPQLIETGVEVHSDTPSVSIHIHDSCVTIGKYSCIKEEPIYARPDPYKVKFFGEWGEKIIGYTHEEVYEQINLNNQIGKRLILDHLYNMAFFRFFEIWDKGTPDDLKRGVAALPRLHRSFAGMFGCQNCEGGIVRRGSNIWYLQDKVHLYPKIKRLPPEGIENARRVARELQKKRENKRGLLP